MPNTIVSKSAFHTAKYAIKNRKELEIYLKEKGFEAEEHLVPYDVHLFFTNKLTNKMVSYTYYTMCTRFAEGVIFKRNPEDITDRRIGVIRMESKEEVLEDLKKFMNN